MLHARPARIRDAASAVVAALVLSASAAAAPRDDVVVKPGRGIGKVELGMTLQQVRRALGGPHATEANRRSLRARGRYVDLTWELPGRTSWEPVIWTVGFRSASRTGPLRVERVSTTSPAQRTAKKIGVGSRAAQVLRAYPRARCLFRQPGKPYPNSWIVVHHEGGGMTAFEVFGAMPLDPDSPYGKVVTVLVQRAWVTSGGRRTGCDIWPE